MKNFKTCLITAGLIFFSIATTEKMAAESQELPTPSPLLITITPSPLQQSVTIVSLAPIPTEITNNLPPVEKILGYEESVLILGIQPDINSVEDTNELDQILKKYETDNYDLERVNPTVKTLRKTSIDSLSNNKLNDTEYRFMPEKQQRLFSAYKVKFNKTNAEVEILEKQLKQEPKIEYVQNNYFYQTSLEPNDPEYTTGHLWGLTSTKTNLAWNSTQGDNIIVAIIDTGVDYNHPDLAGNLWYNDQGSCGYDFSDIDTDPMDYEIHGTHVAGTVAALINNSQGIVGVAPRAKIMAVKVFPNATSTVLAKGLRYAADNGAAVINNSWGPKYRRPDDEIINAAIEYAYSKGCVVVFSAGNSNDDVQYFFGANHPRSLCVGSVNSSLTKASTSNWGSIIKIVAPGESIESLQPGGRYQYLSGTSMAAAHISGLAALLKARYPIYTNDQIVTQIAASASILNLIEIPNAGFMDSYAAINGASTVPVPVPIISSIPAVVVGQNITISGLNFSPGRSNVVITGNGIDQYCNILTCTTTDITFSNKYNYGTYKVQVQNGVSMSNWTTLTIYQTSTGETPEITILPVVEEQEAIGIYGNKYDIGSLQVRVTGMGYDDYAIITFSCRTAIKIANSYSAGSYMITVYNGKTASNSLPLTIYSSNTKPSIVYTTFKGNNTDNWLYGNSGNNIIYGFDGCDTIMGRQGDDLLYGGNGDDTYVYGLGDGLDTIEDNSGNDIIILSGINPDDVTTVRDGNDCIKYVPYGKITIKNQFTTSCVETLGYW